MQELTSSLNKLQSSSQDTRDALTTEIAERHDALLRVKQVTPPPLREGGGSGKGS